MAQIFAEVELTSDQGIRVSAWVKQVLTAKNLDWVVAANAMDALVKPYADGVLPKSDILPLLRIQQTHRSAAVVKRANRLMESLY